MSQQNVDRFIEATEAFNRGDVRAYLASWTPRFSSSLFRPHFKEPMRGERVSGNGSRTSLSTTSWRAPTFASPIFATLYTEFDGSRPKRLVIKVLGE